MDLLTYREKQRKLMPYVESLEDFDILHALSVRSCIISDLLPLGRPVTVRRRIKRFRELDVIRARTSKTDCRATELSLSPKTIRALERIAK